MILKSFKRPRKLPLLDDHFSGVLIASLGPSPKPFEGSLYDDGGGQSLSYLRIRQHMLMMKMDADDDGG